MSGRITVTLTVWCGRHDEEGWCPQWEYLQSTKMRNAHQEAKRLGWTFTREHGWVCPRCNGNCVTRIEQYSDEWCRYCEGREGCKIPHLSNYAERLIKAD